MKSSTKILLRLALALSLPIEASAQLPIYYKEFDYEMVKKAYEIGDTLKFPFQDNNATYIIVMLGDKGHSFFEARDSLGLLTACGIYAPSLDTLAKYVTWLNIIDYSEKIEVHKYFQPLRDGEWTFYDEKRKKKIILYENGIEKK